MTKDELQIMFEKQSLYLAEIIERQQQKIEVLEAEIKGLQDYTKDYTNSIDQRDKRLIDKLEAIQAAQEAQARPWYKRIFK